VIFKCLFNYFWNDVKNHCVRFIVFETFIFHLELLRMVILWGYFMFVHVESRKFVLDC
jgi:hypothetical protein